MKLARINGNLNINKLTDREDTVERKGIKIIKADINGVVKELNKALSDEWLARGYRT